VKVIFSSACGGAVKLGFTSKRVAGEGDGRGLGGGDVLACVAVDRAGSVGTGEVAGVNASEVPHPASRPAVKIAKAQARFPTTCDLAGASMSYLNT
jgi:hypothetical protein